MSHACSCKMQRYVLLLHDMGIQSVDQAAAEVHAVILVVPRSMHRAWQWPPSSSGHHAPLTLSNVHVPD